MSHVCKLFFKVISNRIDTKIDENQSNTQAGFRRNLSTMTHIQTVRELIQKSKEYNRPLIMAFIDFEKAFDSLEHWAIFNALKRCKIDSRYIDIIQNLYSDCNFDINIKGDKTSIKQFRGIRQGDTLSPKLFIAALEDMFKTLKWNRRGIKINGQYLNHLRFADDIVLFADNLSDIETLINDLSQMSLKIGLKINYGKTKMLSNVQGTTVKTESGNTVNFVNDYIYLGQNMSFNTIEDEVSRRIRLSWAAFGILHNVFNPHSNIPQHLKTRVYNQCVLPVLTYGCETWILTKKTIQTIAVNQRHMERKMIGVRLIDRMTNTELRNRTKIEDAVTRIKSLKFQWAGHVARGNNWTNLVHEWIPRANVRARGRPAERWDDDLRRCLGATWRRLTTDRETWRSRREAFCSGVDIPIG